MKEWLKRMKNKTDYKKLYKELDCKYDSLLERHINMSQILNIVRDLISDLERTKKYDEVYRIMSKCVINDIKDAVLNNISYEDTFYEKKSE